MSVRLIKVASVVVTAAVYCVSVRRLVLLIAALIPRPREANESDLPSVTMVVPARNEGVHIERLLDALDHIEYPQKSLFAVLVNDCSDDDTGDRISRWAAARSRVLSVDIPQQIGKAGALNAGIAAAPNSELIAVCDADLRPRPAWLRQLVRSFADETVGAAAGFLVPANADSGLVARYAAVETWVHQLVTSAGKDRLNLNPAAHGASVYRRAALEEVGWFAAGGPGEDVRATAALTKQGWRTRFIQDAIVENTVAEDLRDYWQQHLRWATNVFAAAANAAPGGSQRTRQRLPLRQRIETGFASVGYVDRLFFLCALGLAAAGGITPQLPALYLGAVASEAVVAVTRGGAGRRLPSFLFSMTVMFTVDMLASAIATAIHFHRPRRSWQTPARDKRAVAAS